MNLSRRATLKTICTTIASMSLPVSFSVKGSNSGIARFGVIADLHGGLAIDADARLDAFLSSMQKENVDALIQLGDFAFPNNRHQTYADKINAAHDHVVHVIGNHEFDHGLTRKDCFRAWDIKSAYYRYDIAGMRLLVLDGNEKGSPDYEGGYPSFIGQAQLTWLENELKTADRPVLVLSHQPLAGQSAIDNAVEVQALLSRHDDKIAICINGHSHVDSLVPVDGINYLHINSASYYWVGGKKRMAYYEEPLFTTIAVDIANSTISVEGKSSDWKHGDSPATIDYFDRDDAPSETTVTPGIRKRQIMNFASTEETFQTWPRFRESHFEESKTLKVMTWNIWGRLNQDPRYTVDSKTARQRTIEIIQHSGADIIAMIETYGSATDIAQALGFHHYTPASDANLCIFSRFPLTDVEPLNGLSSFSFIAATATLPSGQKVRVYDIWLTSAGRHIVEIKNKKVSDQTFCEGDDIRFDMLEKFLKHADFQRHLNESDQVPVIVAGDFNCVSHLDHTIATRHSKLNQSRILPIKVSKAMLKSGFTDSYRESNPDLINSTLGHTWTTVGQDHQYIEGKGFVPVENNPRPEYRDPYARIDYIYSIGSRLRPTKSQVIYHHPSEMERSFPEFPSDHAAVLTTFLLKTDD